MQKLILIESQLHKVYHGIYYILNKLYDCKIITYDKTKLPFKMDIIILSSLSIIKESFRYYKGLWGVLKKENPDIVSVRAYYRPYAIIALLFTILYKKKFIIMEEQRNLPKNFLRRILLKILINIIKPIINLKVHKIICISKDCYNFLNKNKFKRLIYIPVPYLFLNRNRNNNNPPLRKKETGFCLKILNVARFKAYKGHIILIKAIHHLINELKVPKQKIKVTLVGEGELKNEIINIVKNLHLDDIIEFSGYIPNHLLNEIYQSHNLFILSSIYEPLGMVVLEAMANKLPVIISSESGIKDAVKPGENGFIFRSGDFKDLATKIKIFYDNPEFLNIFGENSYKILIKERNLELIKKLYKNSIDA